MLLKPADMTSRAKGGALVRWASDRMIELVDLPASHGRRYGGYSMTLPSGKLRQLRKISIIKDVN